MGVLNSYILWREDEYGSLDASREEFAKKPSTGLVAPEVPRVANEVGSGALTDKVLFDQSYAVVAAIRKYDKHHDFSSDRGYESLHLRVVHHS